MTVIIPGRKKRALISLINKTKEMTKKKQFDYNQKYIYIYINKITETVFRVLHCLTVKVLRAASRCVSIVSDVSTKEKIIAFLFKF